MRRLWFLLLLLPFLPLLVATNYLEQGGTYSAVSSVSAADPTASLGLSAVNGSASTFLRSDGAPALDQSIAPTWTGVHQFSDGKLQLKGSSSGTTTLKAAAAAGTTTITLPGATTDFSATGGTSQVVKQTSSGGAFSVARLACADLSDSSTGCSGSTSASGANPSASVGLSAANGSASTFLRSDGAPALDQSIAPTWSGVHQFNDGKLQLKGSSSGTTTLKAAATAGTTTITFPGATTDFSATGGTSQVVKQTSSGGAFSVARLACADLSDSSTGCSGAASASAANPTATISGTAVNGSASTFLRSDGAPALGTAAKTRQITFSFDGNGAVLATGNSLPVVVPFACTISAYSISVALADTGTFKLWRVATGTAIPTSGNSISTSGVAISTGTHVRSTTVSDFTSTAISADDILVGQLSAVGGTTTGAVFNIECTI